MEVRRTRPARGEEVPDDVATRIAAAIDRFLDQGEDFPFATGLAPLPDPAVDPSSEDLPNDWDILDFLAAIGTRNTPLSEPLEEHHIAGAVQLMDLTAKLDLGRRQQLEHWLRVA